MAKTPRGGVIDTFSPNWDGCGDMVLPEGFTLPPLLYLVPLVVVLVVTAVLLWTLRPSVTDRVVLAIVPWMVAGGAAHAMYIAEALPASLEPLFGVPSVYFTIGAIAGVVWLFAEVTTSTRTYHDPALYLFVAGLLAASISLAAVVSWGSSTGDLELLWPTAGLLASVALTGLVWLGLRRYFTASAVLAAWTGVVVVFGHVLDAVSTLIGIDVLGAGERSPLAEAILDIAGMLPTEPYLGEGWLFVVIKVALAGAVVVLFREYLEEEPSRARFLLAIVAGVGLGPGVYNSLLFMLSL